MKAMVAMKAMTVMKSMTAMKGRKTLSAKTRTNGMKAKPRTLSKAMKAMVAMKAMTAMKSMTAMKGRKTLTAKTRTTGMKAKPRTLSKASAKTKRPKKDKHAGKRRPLAAEEVMKRLTGMVVPVIKVNAAEHAVPLVSALKDGGVDVAEITFRTACAAEAIKRASTVQGICVGAGTVLTAKQVDEAVDAGADFIISPGFSPDVASRCKQRKVLYIPAVITPTEVMSAASKWGLRTLKFFPAGNFGGLATLKSYAAVFPDIKFMPTGGVTEANIADYLGLANVVAAGGTWFVAEAAVKKAVESGDWTEFIDGVRKAKAAADAAKK